MFTSQQLTFSFLKPLFMWFIAFGITATIPACSRNQHQFNPHTFRFERTGVRQTPVARQSSADKSPSSPGPGSDAASEAAPAIGQYYRLYLVAADHPNSTAQGYKLRYAPTDKCAELVNLLYPGFGPGGSNKVMYILYSRQDAWQSAYRIIEDMDLPAVEPPVGNTTEQVPASQTWARAVGLIYSSKYPRTVDQQLRESINDLLARTVDNKSQPAQIRWAATIIAGQMLTFDPPDYTAAVDLFSTAETLAAGNSYKEMVARYHQLRARRDIHGKGSIKQQLNESLRQFDKYRQSQCYQSMAALTEKTR